MPRANRYFLPGYVWHITHRCHDRVFLLKAARDRDVWRRCLYEARKRYQLCVLNYIVTSNHIHLLVYDTHGDGAISKSMQLIAGQTAQSFNRRTGRRGAFWDDRYHAVAVGGCDYLRQCLLYIDLNMVRAAAVDHPSAWRHSGYIEIQSPKSRYRIIDLERLAQLLQVASVEQLRTEHYQWVEAGLINGRSKRDPAWTESVAVGSEDFTSTIKGRLGASGLYRKVKREQTRFVLREGAAAYNAVDGVKSSM
ncbi:MAG: putative transposase [Gammaproteobacteria bacterium]|jgi:putative transposase